MLLTYDALLWLLVAFHVVGAAALFLRLFPDESPWLAFLLPALGLVVVLNFIEHLVALPTLAWLLPFTLVAFSRSLLRPGVPWRALGVPTALLLLAFAFNFAVKCLHPGIPPDDSMADLNRVLDFSLGDKLPPTDSWLPPFDHRWYYTFQHYAASVVERLFALNLGTACNVSFTLLNALIGFAGAGIAYLMGGRRTWVALVALALLEAGFNGAMPLVWLETHNVDFNYSADLDTGWRDHNPVAIYQILGAGTHYALPLEPPGLWLWEGQYHANLSGFLLMFLAALAALLVLDGPRGRWPWCCLLLAPPLTFLSATWYLPACSVLAGSALAAAWLLGRRPASLRFVLGVTVLTLALLLPAIATLAGWKHHQAFGWTTSQQHTPFWIFVFQWWPVYLPWLALCFFWRGLGAGARWLHLTVGGLFALVELFNVGGYWRWDMIEKNWGGIFGLGLVGLVPLLLSRNRIAAWAVAGLVIAAGLPILWSRADSALRWVDWNEDFLHLDGTGYLRTDPPEAALLQTLSRLHARTVLAGVCDWNYTPPVAPVVFSMNRAYVAWSFTEEICGRGDEANRRSALNNSFYAGTLPHPLDFLRDNRIDAVLIAPQDKIADARLAQLRTALAPEFDYVDCKAGGAGNAGVFLRRFLPPAAHG
jgi:hypothetical protein